jgi:hypothetical protein
MTETVVVEMDVTREQCESIEEYRYHFACIMLVKKQNGGSEGKVVVTTVKKNQNNKRRPCEAAVQTGTKICKRVKKTCT